MWPARGPGITLTDDCAHGEDAGITHSDRDARSYVHRNTYTSADCYRCTAPSDAGCDFHINT